MHDEVLRSSHYGSLLSDLGNKLVDGPRQKMYRHVCSQQDALDGNLLGWEQEKKGK